VEQSQAILRTSRPLEAHAAQSPVNPDDSIATRASLLNSLRDLDNQESWQRFYQIYAPLIRRVAVKAGLTELEAEDIIQETVISVARHLPGFDYDPKICSFKTWMLRMTRWRIIDHRRRRVPGIQPIEHLDDDETAVQSLNELTGGTASELLRVWEEEWQKALLPRALERVKQRVNPEQFQMFDLYALRQMPVREVAKLMGVNVARVYLAKHRVAAMIRQEIRLLEQEGT
jgi:RNA polymerase sigma factor (sigma-70 family)